MQSIALKLNRAAINGHQLLNWLVATQKSSKQVFYKPNCLHKHISSHHVSFTVSSALTIHHAHNLCQVHL